MCMAAVFIHYLSFYCKMQLFAALSGDTIDTCLASRVRSYNMCFLQVIQHSGALVICKGDCRSDLKILLWSVVTKLDIPRSGKNRHTH